MTIASRNDPILLAPIAAILVASRVMPSFKEVLTGFSFGWANIVGEEGVSGSIQPLYLPGGISLMVVIITAFMHRMNPVELGKAVSESTRTLLGAGFVLVFTIPMVRILINSGVDGADLVSMPVAMAQIVADSVGDVYPLFALAVEGLGALIAGSNNVSNLMLSDSQFNVAINLGVSSATIVALQGVGAAAGNMIAIHNGVAASATVGMLGREGMTLRMTIIPTLYYFLLAGVLGMIAFYSLNAGDALMRLARGG